MELSFAQSVHGGIILPLNPSVACPERYGKAPDGWRDARSYRPRDLAERDTA
jgi:hypothetical protein